MYKRKIAVLYICIGNYYVMWNGFYESARKFFFVDDEVHFFVFTDNQELLKLDVADVTFLKEKNYGWPGNTLFRFRMFSSLNDELVKYDFAYFFNANAYFVKPISDEVLPCKGASIVAAQHFKMQGLDPIQYGYDRNPKSTAGVNWGYEGKDYVQACFIGATAGEMIAMCKTLSENIALDEKNGVVAKWHDESHFNKYIIGKNYNLLAVSYVYPEVLNLPIEINILMRRKEQFGELNVLRYGNKSVFRNFKEKAINQGRKIQIVYHMILKNLGVYK